MKFNELDINQKLLKQLEKQNISKLTPIQKECIPTILDGIDVVAQAETGSGKTIAFVLPILEKINIKNKLQVLVITPTRELCLQVTDVFRELGETMGVKVTSVYGGVAIAPQIKDIRNSNIIVATPGRLKDHIYRKTINLENIRFLVIDETDKMFEMGFREDIEEIIGILPPNRQTLLFSATINEDIPQIAGKYLKQPVFIKTKSLIETSKLKQRYYDLHRVDEKFSLLLHLLRNSTNGLAIVFCSTRKRTDIVAENLKLQGINALPIHGGMSQNKRQKSLEKLRKQKIDVLVATDVAARGLDIQNVTHVYNYDVPKTPKEYIHRIGRTARAGAKGDAVTILTQPDHENFRRVQSDKTLEIKREEIPSFNRVPFIMKQESKKYDRNNNTKRRKRFSSNKPSSYRRNRGTPRGTYFIPYDLTEENR